MTPRIPPKNGAAFAPGQVIRVEFPAQGYIDPLNTTLEFDLTIWGFGTPGAGEVLRVQNNVQSIFNRVRLLYGATPLEDIINYNVVMRALTEWTATNQQGTMDQTSIAEGIGGFIWGSTTGGWQGNVSTRGKYIQGISAMTGIASDIRGGTQYGQVPNNATPPSGVIVPAGAYSSTRRYQINFGLGLFTQDKLIPTKFMASQLAIELTLEQPAACLYYPDAGVGSGTTPGYGVGNVNLIPEILQFDASYDAMFLKGLREGGVPLKFSSWHTFIFSSSSSANLQLLVQERSRSVKALFAVQRRAQPSLFVDTGALFFDTSSGGGTLQTYQYRVGGRYFPAAPVQCSTEIGSFVSNGACEAYVELSKALNIVGDYRLSTNTNAKNWAVPPTLGGLLPEYDYSTSITSYSAAGLPVQLLTETSTNSFVGTLPSGAFAMAINLETSNGIEISGLNAEEQSDIALIANWYGSQVTGVTATPSNVEVYTFYDAMIILRENNVLELIQ